MIIEFFERPGSSSKAILGISFIETISILIVTCLVIPLSEENTSYVKESAQLIFELGEYTIPASSGLKSSIPFSGFDVIVY